MPAALPSVQRSQPSPIEMSSVKTGCVGCHAEASTAPASLSPTMNAAWFVKMKTPQPRKIGASRRCSRTRPSWYSANIISRMPAATSRSSAKTIGLNLATPSLPTMEPPPKMHWPRMSAPWTRQSGGRFGSGFSVSGTSRRGSSRRTPSRCVLIGLLMVAGNAVASSRPSSTAACAEEPSSPPSRSRATSAERRVAHTPRPRRQHGGPSPTRDLLTLKVLRSK